MKKIFCIIICIFASILLTGCEDDNKVDEIKFDMEFYASSGQKIDFEIKDSDIISVSSETTSEEKDGEIVDGGKSVTHYTIKGKNKGETQVAFILTSRNNRIIEKRVYTIKVDSKLKMTESHIRV